MIDTIICNDQDEPTEGPSMEILLIDDSMLQQQPTTIIVHEFFDPIDRDAGDNNPDAEQHHSDRRPISNADKIRQSDHERDDIGLPSSLLLIAQCHVRDHKSRPWFIVQIPAPPLP